jgi:transcription termination factor Rho
MSVEPTTLERSALERKDRDELTTIAQALGAKPRPRARKAEIVQLILELTGVETADVVPEGGATVSDHSSVDNPADAPDSSTTSAPSDGGSTADAAASGAAASTPAAGAEDALASSPATEASASSPSDAAPSSGSTSDASPASGGDAAPSPTGDAAAAAGGGTETAPTNGKADSKAPDRSDQRRGDKAQGRGDGRPEQRNGQKGDGQQQVDVAEPGNRRRRRRGRNRGGESSHVEEYTGEPVEVTGLLDLRDEGYGFLRVKGSLPSKDDIYVSVKQARQFGLRKGDHVKGASRPALRNEKNPALLRIDKVNGTDPDQARKRRKFEDLTPLFPDEKLRLETTDDPGNMTARIIDLISPIGKGQRGLIVSPPKAGKTTIVKQIVRSIEMNNPEVQLIVLLVDERPEEVTDMRRWLRNPSSEVVASTFDRPADEHAQISELTIERAKRLVEDGQDVCIVLDGITRLARAYNLAAPATGRIMSGGVDSGALYPPKKFFGAARNVEEGGSLTILATALIETGSKMDEVIFEEFKGTGNMELRLDRRLAERRVYPAIDVDASSTRHEELLFPRNQLNLVWALRRVLSGLSSTDGGNAAALELLIDRMKTFRTNDEFLAEVAKNRLAAG